MQKKHFFWIVPALILFLSLFCAEIYLRAQATQIINAKQNGRFLLESNPEFLIQHTPKGKRLIPYAEVLIKNHQLGHRDIPIRINSNGFRGEELRIKTTDEFRILVLGDSITWGDYLFEDEIFHSFLDAHTLSNGQKIRVMNAGVGDIGIEEMVDIYFEQFNSVQPDMVLLNLYLNDSRPPWGFPEEISQRGWLRRYLRIAEFLYKRVRLYQWIEEKGAHRFAWVSLQSTLDWKHNQEDFQTLVQAAQYDWGAGWQPESSALVSLYIEKLHLHTKSQQIPLLATILPVAYQVHAEFLNDTPQQMLNKSLASFSIPTLDFLPLLRNNAHEKLYYDQCHPNPHGNAIMGSALKEFVLSQASKTPSY